MPQERELNTWGCFDFPIRVEQQNKSANRVDASLRRAGTLLGRG